MPDSSTEASLRYLHPGIDRPVYVASEGGADAALSIGAEFDDHAVAVVDARQLSPPPNLHKQGFALVSHKTGVLDFYALHGQKAGHAANAEKTSYEEELCELVLAATGASSALVFDHTLRSDSRRVRGEHSTREPASVIHNDYTDASAVVRLRDLLPASEAEQRLQHRFAIVNVWRSIKGPVVNSPLAICDFSSAAPVDFVASERRAKERIGELELVTYNPSHRWYYFPLMQYDEALLLKTFDSARDGTARRVAHTAFRDPLAPSDAPPRESIESRLMVFFDE